MIISKNFKKWLHYVLLNMSFAILLLGFISALIAERKVKV